MSLFLVLLLSAVSGPGYPQEDPTGTIHLSPADQLILEEIRKVNDRIDKVNITVITEIGKVNERIDKINERIDGINGRIDKLWMTMLGGFLGVMAFIGGIVFWDRRTFLKRTREECREEMAGDREKLEALLAAMKKLSEQYPEVRQVLNNFGLL